MPRHESVWTATAPPSDYAPLDDDVDADLAVVGGGITGITTALFASRAGINVVRIEADRAPLSRG